MKVRGPIFCQLLLLLAFCLPVLAGERITSFSSNVSIEPSGLMTVIETITVMAEGKKIKRGIYRDFPIRYTNKDGHPMRVGFKLLGVQREERPEPYHTKQIADGIRIYIGDSNTYLKHGLYSYTIIYQTDRQIAFFSDYDELYWNVTGNDWAFPIDEVNATIVLPEGATIVQHRLYTGRRGSVQADGYVTTGRLANQIRFTSTKGLAPQEGFTVAVAWPKGVVSEPDLRDKAHFLFRDNISLITGGAGLIILLLYYGISWQLVGRDPKADIIIPRFEPPDGFSPTASRFVMRMGFDNKAFAAAVVSLAVKKHLIIQDDGKVFTLKKVVDKSRQPLSRGEKKILKQLFSGASSLELKKTNHQRINRAISILKKSIRDEFEILHFRRNSIYLLPGLAITMAIVLVVIMTAQQRDMAAFLTIWLTFWSGGCYFLFKRALSDWQLALANGSRIMDKVGAVFSTLFALPFWGGLVFGFYALTTTAALGGVLALLVALAVNVLFYQLLKAPTLQGRGVMDHLEGLKQYLTVAEQERLNLLNPPDKTPELFERFLPWALALDVEQQWSEQFSDLLERAGQGDNYSPSWFQGHRSFSSTAIASSLGTSLASSIASSSHAPSSSSGSGGGGFSGGGGGGGGGGGW